MTKRNTRTDLDKTISRLQKNTRNKLYRMRKAGASAEDVYYIDPRKSTEGMTTAEKKAYARELTDFNKRGGTYSLSRDYWGDVGIIPTKKLNEYQRAEKKFNEWITKVRNNAQKQYGQLPYFAGEVPNPVSREEWERMYGPMRQNAYNSNNLQNVRREYGFANEQQLDNAIKHLNKRMENVRKIDRNLTNYKNAIANKMESEGVGDDAVKAIRSLTRSQLQYLYLNTDFSDLVKMYHYSNYYDTHIRASQSIYNSTADLLIGMVKTAKKFAPKKYVPISRVAKA